MILNCTYISTKDRATLIVNPAGILKRFFAILVKRSADGIAPSATGFFQSKECPPHLSNVPRRLIHGKNSNHRAEKDTAEKTPRLSPLAFAALAREHVKIGILGRFLFRSQPEWVERLQPHMRPAPDQIKRLEALRRRLGVSHDEFHLHIAGHPATTRKVQHHFYNDLKRRRRHLDHDQRLAALVTSRWQASLNAGQDYFGLGQCNADTFETRVAELARQAKTVDGLADLFIEEESKWLIPPAPGFESAATEVSEILGEPRRGHELASVSPPPGQGDFVAGNSQDVIVVCPHCMAKNQISAPLEKAGYHGCGACGRRFESKCTLEELAQFTLGLVFRDEFVDTFAQVIQKTSPLSATALSWEIIVLRFFYARGAIMQTLQDFKPAIDAVHRMLFGAFLKQAGSAGMAEAEEWIESRLSAYTEAFNSNAGRPADCILAVGRKFSKFVGVNEATKYEPEYLANLMTQSAIHSAVRDFLTKYRIG